MTQGAYRESCAGCDERDARIDKLDNECLSLKEEIEIWADQVEFLKSRKPVRLSTKLWVIAALLIIGLFSVTIHVFGLKATVPGILVFGGGGALALIIAGGICRENGN